MEKILNFIDHHPTAFIVIGVTCGVVIFGLIAYWQARAGNKENKSRVEKIFLWNVAWSTGSTSYMNIKTALIPVVLIVGGVAIWLTGQQGSINKQEQLAFVDPACNGQANEYADLGFGVEHTYTGNLKEGLPVEIVLSCDHESFKIEGSVTQKISLEDLERIDSELNHNYELANIGSGNEVVDVNSDYNFDGYNDLSSVAINGSEVDSTFIFLYNPVIRQFEYNTELSHLENIILDSSKKYVQEDLSYYTESGEHIDGIYKTYIWVNGHLKLKN